MQQPKLMQCNALRLVSSLLYPVPIPAIYAAAAKAVAEPLEGLEESELKAELAQKLNTHLRPLGMNVLTECDQLPRTPTRRTF